MGANTIVTIPEVQHAIGASLHKGDLARCILVCRTWHDAFIPFVWQELKQCDAIKLSKVGYTGLPAFGRYIRRLSIHPPEELDHYVAHCHNLVELSVHDISHRYPFQEHSVTASVANSVNDTPQPLVTSATTNAPAPQPVSNSDPSFRAGTALSLNSQADIATLTAPTCQTPIKAQPYDAKVQPVVRMVAANPSLKSLSLRVYHNIPFTVVYDMIGTAASNLNHLLIHYTDRPPTIMTSTTILDLLEKCPNLTSFQFVADSLVSVRRTRYYLEDRLARWRKMQQHQWPHTSSGQDERQHHGPYKLKKLSITFANMHQSRLPFIFTLLQLCPELQTLVVPDNPSSTLPTLEHILHYDLRQLTSLDLTYYGFSVPLDDASLARIVRAIHANQLRTFKTWGAYNYETFLSLAEHHSQSIRVIDMSGYRGYVSSKGVQRVLSTCPNLESFKTGAYDPRRGFLLAEDIVQSEWVCNNLQVLEVPIGGVCRFAPGEKCPQHPTETQPEVRCRAIQRGVYRQLGKLQWLRELDVHMFNNSTIEGPQLATLEWSLASGLDETRNLKHLESFIFHGTNNAIGIEELKWMKEHWTSLRSLLHFRKDQMEQSLWLVSNWREMVPFIDAIGLSLP